MILLSSGSFLTRKTFCSKSFYLLRGYLGVCPGSFPFFIDDLIGLQQAPVFANGVDNAELQFNLAH